MNSEHPYNLTELLACVAASLLEAGSSVIVGTGLPLVAGMLAQRTHAPGLLIIFEAASSMHDVMSACQAGYVDYDFLGGAAMDCYGNVNTTVIGDWSHLKVRLPGSGGANDVASFCWRTIYLMRQQSPRTFVKQLDFITIPGFLTGTGAREQAGLSAGNGPYRVITQLGVYGFDDATKRLQLLALHPGVTVEQAQEASEFEILITGKVTISDEPTPEQFCVLREIDPGGMVIGK